MRIIIIEDDDSIGESLKRGLSKRDHIVDWVKNEITALSAIQNEYFDMVILDMNLLKASGEELLKNIRKKDTHTPVIALTSINSTESLVKNFDLGADDYIIKPFDIEVLCARIYAIHRRICNQFVTTTLKSGDLSLDPTTRIVLKTGKQIKLTRREFMLMQILLENVGKVVQRDQAVQSIYGWGYDIDSNALEVHIHNLRKKLNLNNLVTIRGIGYVLRSPEQLHCD